MSDQTEKKKKRKYVKWTIYMYKCLIEGVISNFDSCKEKTDWKSIQNLYPASFKDLKHQVLQTHYKKLGLDNCKTRQDLISIKDTFEKMGMEFFNTHKDGNFNINTF
jgi:hypothetical protein